METIQPMTLRTPVRRKLASLIRHAGGNTLALVGLAMIPMVGTVGLGVDVAQWVVWKRQLHTAADLGALAGARALEDKQPVDLNVRRSLAQNNLRSFTTVAIENAPTVGPYTGDAAKVRVVLSTQSALPFSGMFLSSAPLITVEATAERANEVPNCVIALDNSGTALEITGSASVIMNCGLASNSDLLADASSPIQAGALSAVGTVTAGGNVDPDTKINDGVSPITDPIAGKHSIPDLTSICSGATSFSAKGKSVVPISPGCYTNISVGADMTMAAGTYYLDGGNFNVGSNVFLKGENVTLVFTNSDKSSPVIGKFSGNGNSTVQLTAPATGPFAGILMYQDPRAGPPRTATNLFLAGTSGTDASGKTVTSTYEGLIYTPATKTRFLGNSGIDTPCMQIVAFQVEFTGNTNVTNNCPAGKGAASNSGFTSVRLVR